MNQATLDFIRQHQDDDVRQLAFLGSKYPEVDMPFALDQIRGRKMARTKLPRWASIYGIILLFLALETKLIKVKHIRETSSFLIAIMPVMFIPAAVGLIDSYQDIGNAWFQYIVVTVVSTFVVMGASGWITQLVIRKGKEAKK